MGLDTHPDYVLAAGATFAALCPIIVALRFYTRSLQGVRYGLDDWLTLPALLMVIGCCADLIVGVRLKVYGYPTPKPSGTQNPDDQMSYSFTVIEQLEWAFFMMQILSMGFVKTSFVFFFRRIFVNRNARTRFDIVSTITWLVVVAWTAAFFFWFLFSCKTDFAARWTTLNTLHMGCPTDVPSDLALAISDMVTDVMVLGLPVPLVLRLRMKLSRKLAILAIFSLALIALVASIIRLAIFVRVTRIAAGVTDTHADNNLLITQSLYWSTLECGLALIACCLPTLSGLSRSKSVKSTVARMRGRFFSKTPDQTPSTEKVIVKESKPPTVGFTDSMLKVSALQQSEDREPATVAVAKDDSALGFEENALREESDSSLEGQRSEGKLSIV